MSKSSLASEEGQDTAVASTAAGLPVSIWPAGTACARFTNCYSPYCDAPSARSELNSGAYLHPRLCELLEDDRRNNLVHHVRTDKQLKEYLLAVHQHEPRFKTTSHTTH